MREKITMADQQTTDPESITVERPTTEILDFIFWAIGAAVGEFYVTTDDRSDVDKATAWVEKIAQACK